METIYPKLLISDDGSLTLTHPLFGDTYHSTAGAVGESMHVYIENGLKTVAQSHDEIKTLEMGFGSGLNFLLTVEYALQNNLKIDYTTIELFPVDMEIIMMLGYEKYVSAQTYELYKAAHLVQWGERVVLSDKICITKISQSLPDVRLDRGKIDLVYYDAFAPDTQPELWSEEIFSMIHDAVCEGGVLVTYSAKGVVKQALRAAGFEVFRKKGALGKHHQLFCVKK